MKENIYVPSYYKDFQCIADRCQHTCCAGWEIDIDEDSLARFQNMTGEIGARLKANIEMDSVPHFRLQPGDRCPFLRGDGLCDLILECGEDVLCQICTDHPRFRNFWTGRVEVGLGLACEEAARLILGQETPMRLVRLEAGPEAMGKVGEDPGDFSDLPGDEAYLMGVRQDLLKEAEKISEPMVARLAEYLIFRYVADALYDDRLDQRIGLVQRMLSDLVGRWNAAEDQSFENLCDIARQYSNEVEYNEDLIESWLVELS